MFKKQNELKSQSHRPIEDQSSHTSTADHDLPHKLRDVNNSSKVAKKEPVVVKFQDPQKRKRKLTTEDNHNNSKTGK